MKVYMDKIQETNTGLNRNIMLYKTLKKAFVDIFKRKIFVCVHMCIHTNPYLSISLLRMGQIMQN